MVLGGIAFKRNVFLIVKIAMYFFITRLSKYKKMQLIPKNIFWTCTRKGCIQNNYNTSLSKAWPYFASTCSFKLVIVNYVYLTAYVKRVTNIVLKRACMYIYIYFKNNYTISLIFGMHKLYSFGFDKMTFFFHKQLWLFPDIRTLFMLSGKKWTKTDLKMLFKKKITITLKSMALK